MWKNLKNLLNYQVKYGEINENKVDIQNQKFTSLQKMGQLVLYKKILMHFQSLRNVV